MWSELYHWALTSKKNKHIIKIFQAFMITEKIRLSNRIYGFFLFSNYCLFNRFFFRNPAFFNPSCVRVFEKKLASHIIKVKDIFVWRASKALRLKDSYDF
jgi:hypothetical protein